MSYMSPTQAGGIAHRLMELVAAKALSAAEFVAVQYVLFHERKTGCDRAKVDLTTICKATGRRREAAVNGLRVAEAHGLLTKLKTRQWVIQGGRRVCRNGTNTYIFRVPGPESRRRTVPQKNQSLSSSAFVRTKALEKFERTYPDFSENIEAALQRVAAAAGFSVPV
jgi:hypothetical protein